MTASLDLIGELTLTDEAGGQLLVKGRGDTVSVDLPSLWAGRALAKQAPGRSKRAQAIGTIQAGLRHADLRLQLRVAGRPVAYLAPDSKPTLLPRLLGLGSMELKPLSLILAMFRR